MKIDLFSDVRPKIRFAFLCATGLSTVIALSAPAKAEIATITYEGVLDNFFRRNVDHLGLFGAPGADYTGAAFKVVYTLDTSKGTATSGGWQGLGLDNPLSLAVTVNGVSFAIANGVDPSFSTGLTETSYTPGPAFSTHSDTWITDWPGTVWQTGSGAAMAYGSVSALLPSFGTPFDIDAEGIDDVDSWINVSFYADNYPSAVGNYINLQSSGANLHRVAFAWADTTPVPEPASWAMMIAGFAGAGGLMRRRAARRPGRWCGLSA